MNCDPWCDYILEVCNVCLVYFENLVNISLYINEWVNEWIPILEEIQKMKCEVYSYSFIFIKSYS